MPNRGTPAPLGREGDNLYTSSIVAVHADTGEYAWHYQETPEDRWDLDSNAQITVAELVLDGKQRRVVVHAPKNGFLYVLDASTGQFISAGQIGPQNWAIGIDPTTGRATINPEARYERTGKLFMGMPGGAGTHSWPPMSYSPKTGLVYIPAVFSAYPFAVEKGWKESAMGNQTAADYAYLDMPSDGAASDLPNSGALLAWDPVNQKEAWRVEREVPLSGGTLATAGNLVFQGTPPSDFTAYRADTGEKLWSFALQTTAAAGPMSYAVDGEQYVAILAGWGGTAPNRSRLLVFKLGGKAKLPPVPVEETMKPIDPPRFTGTPGQVARGGNLYARYCLVCHMGMFNNPVLTQSPVLHNPDTMEAIVIDGALKHNGMASFSPVLNGQDVEAIRQYVVKRANDGRGKAR